MERRLRPVSYTHLGGTKRLAAVVEKMVPVMAAIYIVGSLILIAMNITALPGALQMIFVGAFNPQAILGGAAGITVREAIRYGVARGLFSNEAGMGSTPHAHARAAAKNPHEQGMTDVYKRQKLSLPVKIQLGEDDLVDLLHHAAAHEGLLPPDPGAQ